MLLPGRKKKILSTPVPVVMIMFFFVLASCSKDSSYTPCDYIVVNHTGGNIRAEFNGLIGTYGYPRPIEDTVVHIAPGEQSTLCILLTDNGDGSNPESGNDSLHCMNVLRIFLEDTIPSNKNFMLTRYWSFHKISNRHGELSLEVNGEDFLK